MNAAIDAAAQVKPNDPRLTFYRGVAIVSSGSDFSRAEEYSEILPREHARPK